MSDDQGGSFFQNWHDQWIQPELDRRFGESGIPDDFKILQCRILLPIDQASIVQFNDEVGWGVENPTLAGGKSLADMDFGEPVHIFDILGIQNVLPPTVHGTRVSFMFLYWDGFEYRLFVDFIPNQPDYDPDDEHFKFDGTVIADHLHNWLIERVVQWAKVHQLKLRRVGLWTATPLLPYPLAKIIERIDVGKPDEARQLLVQ